VWWEGDSQCGDVETVGGSQCSKTHVGTGDPAACLRLLGRLVYKVDDESLCQPKPCAIGTFYQPTLPLDMHFYAVGAFIYTLDAIGALDNRGRYLPHVGFDKAFEYCQKVLHSPLSVNVLLCSVCLMPSAHLTASKIKLTVLATFILFYFITRLFFQQIQTTEIK